jgi:phosphate transport system substrate-binding protein
VDFALSDKGASALRAHSLVPYAAGSTLIAMDASRRSRILAQVGAHASAEPAQVAAAPSRPMLAASAAAAHPAAPATPALNKVSGTVVAAPQPTSLKGVRGDAFTEVLASNRGSFAHVTSEAYVSYAKAPAGKAMATRPGSTANPGDKPQAGRKVAASVSKPARTYRVAAGETLYSIARKHGVDVAQIRSWNHLKDNTVRTGQVLRIQSR